MRTLSQDSMKAVQGFLFAIAIVIVIALWASTARAGQGPTKEDLAHFQAIIDRQPRIQELKPLRDELEALKAENVKDVSALNKNGYNIDWSTLKLTPYSGF